MGFKINAQRTQSLETAFNEAQKAYMESDGEQSKDFDRWATSWVHLVLGPLEGEKKIQKQIYHGANNRGEALAFILFGEPR